MIADLKSYLYIYIGFLMEAIIVFCTMSEQKGTVSLVFTLTFLWIVMFYFHTERYTYRQGYLNVLVLSTIFFSFLNVFAFAPTGGFDYFKKVIMFSCFMLLLYANTKYVLTLRQTNQIILINILISLLYLIFYRQGYSFYEGKMLLTLKFNNPNETGMFILNSLLYTTIPLFTYRQLCIKKIFLPILLLIIFFLSYVMFLTGCRSSFLSYAVFVFLVFLDFAFFKYFKVKHIWIFIWAIAPFLFALVYLSYSQLLKGIDVSFGFGEGKSSSTRLIVWVPAMDAIKHNIIFGDYFGISNGSGRSQMHNTHLDVLASYGLLPFVLFVSSLYKAVENCLTEDMSRINRFGLYAFMVCFISGTFEASLVAGGAGIYILSCGFLLIAKSNVYINSGSYDELYYY